MPWWMAALTFGLLCGAPLGLDGAMTAEGNPGR
jgi:hypothetical protein